MHGEYKVPGGKLVVVDFTVVDGRFSGVQISGDFFLEPDTGWIQPVVATPSTRRCLWDDPQAG